MKHKTYNDGILYNGDCLKVLPKLSNIDLTITSPPYYNARDYSHYSSFDDYMNQMKDIFTEVYKKTNNHRYLILNVGDVVCSIPNHNKVKKKYPLSAYFITMLENIGWEYIDDYIWDKGEPQSKRHLGNPQYPFYQYPVNCYEHIIVFAKHEYDKTKLCCPVCHSNNVAINGIVSIGVESFECKNKDCPSLSKGGRGKRFSARSIMMNNYKTENNFIPYDFIQEFRRDIVKINPVIKVNSKGNNLVGHTAPFPEKIPEMAIRYFSGVNDIVLDPFAGSGTTCLVARNLNRKFIGIEKDENYYKVCKNKLKEIKSLF